MTTTPAAQTPAETTPLPPRRMGCQIALLSFIAVLALAALLGYWAWKSEPDYWQKNQELRKRDNASLLQAATELDTRLLAQVSEAGPGEDPLANIGKERTIFVSTDEINSWLAAKLNDWLINQNVRIPPQVKDMMVAIDGGELVLAFRYDAPEVNQVISATVDVAADDEGDLILNEQGKGTITMSDVHGGRLPLPVNWVVNLLKKNNTAEDKAEQVEKIAQLLKGVPFEPVQEIDQIRQVRLLGYELKDDGIEMRVRTEMRAKH